MYVMVCGVIEDMVLICHFLNYILIAAALKSPLKIYIGNNTACPLEYTGHNYLLTNDMTHVGLNRNYKLILQLNNDN